MTTSSSPLIPPLDESSLPRFFTHPDPSIYLGGNYVVLDFETTNHDKGSPVNPENRIICAVYRLGPDHPQGRQLRYGGSRVRVCVGSEYEQGRLLADIGESSFIVAHHAKYELQWLKRCGIDLRRVLPYCTQIGEYVRSGNRLWRLGLDAVAGRYEVGNKLTLVSSMIKGGICPSEIPLDLLVEYCDKDVELTEQIFLKQRELLNNDKLLPVTYCRNLFTPVLADIEFTGLQLDASRVRETFDGVRQEFNEAKTRFDELTGGINQNSPKQLREFLFDKLGFEPAKDHRGNPILTSTGAYSTAKGTIGLLKATNNEQRRFVDAYKRLIPLKKRVQLLEQLVKCVEDDNGNLFATFNQTVTQTHRLSSSGRKYGIQFQNFPRAYKSLFRARGDGCLLVEGDAPQLEFRVAADLGGDQHAIRGICNGVDVHKLTSTVMGLDRTSAKAFTFKPLYGGMSGNAKERAYYEAFRREYRDIYNTQQGWVYRVLADKSLRIASGLRFYWDDTKVQASGYVTNTPSIFNYPVQSFATADIVPLCVTATWHRIVDFGGEISLVNTVHDSVVAEVPEGMLSYYSTVLKRAFTEDIYLLIERLYGRKLKVPLGVGIKAGLHWGEGEEVKLEAVEKIQENLQSDLGIDTRAA